MKVSELMSKRVITVTQDMSLRQVGDILRDDRVSGLPVVSGDNTLVGIITLTDMLRLLDRIYKWKEIEGTGSSDGLSTMFEEEKKKAKVADFMTRDVFTLNEDDNVEDIMHLMFAKQVHTLPVLKDGKLVGIVGKRDLIHACF
ncbi:MAG: CBS domain-containing protein [Candidatus Omnitrophica bacterium]|nr:CBS domain-containing protein [Candidatus Omnitrophota bacterium]MDD5441602.1 CBS domain-containing protein [Candidatus Omnitrophota bacterium]